MKLFILVAVVFCAFSYSIARPNTRSERSKREAHQLPDGYEEILGTYDNSFTCDGKTFGYYADMANQCKVFHICQPITLADGTEQVEHWSFLCGNQTVFNQYSLTCSHPDEAIPCDQSPQFYYLNERIGQPTELLHKEEDAKSYRDIVGEKFGKRGQ